MPVILLILGFVLGLSTIIKPLPVQSSDTVHIAAALVGNVVLFLCMFTGKRKILDRWEGALLILGYFAYLYLVFLGVSFFLAMT